MFCDPSLEPSLRDGSNDGSQNMFYGEIWPIIPKLSLLPPSYLEQCILTQLSSIPLEGKNKGLAPSPKTSYSHLCLQIRLRSCPIHEI